MFLPLIVLLPAAAHAQAIEAWVQRYDSNLRNSPGPTVDLAVDAGGNVYLLCPSQRDYLLEGQEISDWATIKYSSSGVPLWTNLYGAADYGGWPRALAVGSSGNVFVTGTEHGWGANYCATVKYASDGSTLWTRNAGSGEGIALAVDSSGNVCVAASADNGFLTIKYSSAGNTLWTKRYNGSGSNYDFPIAVATDALDNIVVAGHSSTPSDPNCATLVKYSSGGVPLWTRTCRGLFLGRSPLALDSSGNVLVTGDAYTPGMTTHDFLTIKYSSAGVLLWTNRYDGPEAGSDYPNAVTVDASGDVYVTGPAESGTIQDYATLKYSSAGIPLWTNYYNGPGSWSDTSLALVVAPDSSVFVTGQSSYSGGNDSTCATVAYSSSGAPLWINLCNRPGNTINTGSAITVDADGCVYVAGASMGSDGKLDLALVKYVTPPIITRQPGNRTNAIGTTASFSVEVGGSAPFTYQWRRDGTNLVDGGNLSGVATTNLLIATVQLEDGCDYTVVVANEWGSATSTIAHLTVITPPSAGRFTNLSYSPATGFSFIFRDATIGQHYRIQRSSSAAEGTWVDWLNFTYTEPMTLIDGGATTTSTRFYRAVSP